MDTAPTSSNAATAYAVRPHVPQPQWEQFAVMPDFNYTHTQPQWLEAQGPTPSAHQTPTAVPPHQELSIVHRHAGAEADQTNDNNNRNSSSGADVHGRDASAHRGHTSTSFTPSAVSRTPVWQPSIIRPPPLESRRLCMTCLQLKEACTCRTCHVCGASFLKNRHHCRRCWRAVCGSCWGAQHHVHMLGRPMPVCDRCAVPWALASVSKRDESGLLWGLYALRIAGQMPRMCINPVCRTFTRRSVCYVCGLPTVTTQPHMGRVVRSNGVSSTVMDTINVIDVQQLTVRAMEVDGMTRGDVESTFRRYFRRYEETVAFRSITSAEAAQRILLSNVAAAVAYEYVGAPNLTLGLSDIPYARVLQVSVSRERYTILEAPGRVKFVAFPGTHNWRTRWVGAQFSRVEESVWTRLNDGVRQSTGAAAAGVFGGEPGNPVHLCGGVRKTWSYQVHGGFAREAQEVGLPLDELLDDVRRGGYTLVLCGHSLGGAIAQYLTLQLLHRAAHVLVPANTVTSTPRIMCVSFGAPLLGNYELADHVRACGWSSIFHNFVYRGDVVPRLFCADEVTWDAVARVRQSVSSVFDAMQRWWRGDRNKKKDVWEGERSPPSAGLDMATAPREAEPSVQPGNAGKGSKRSGVAAMAARAFGGGPNSSSGSGSGKAAQAAVLTAADGGASDSAAAAGASNASFDSAEATAEDARLTAFMDTAIRTSRDLLEDDRSAGAADGTGSLMTGGGSKDRDTYRDGEFRTVDGLPAGSQARGHRTTAEAEAALQDAEVEAALTAFATRCHRVDVSRNVSSVRRARREVRGAAVDNEEEAEEEHVRGPQQQYHEAADQQRLHSSSGSRDDEENTLIREDVDVESEGDDGVAHVAASTLRRDRSRVVSHPNQFEAVQLPPPQFPDVNAAAASPLVAPADVTADVVIPSRRMHRRFSCFGRYHFVQYGCYGYMSTDDSETAFGILKHGCGEGTGLGDHSVAAYNRGMMIHLYRNKA